MNIVINEKIFTHLVQGGEVVVSDGVNDDVALILQDIGFGIMISKLNFAAQQATNGKDQVGQIRRFLNDGTEYIPGDS